MGLGESMGRAVILGSFGSMALRQVLGLTWGILLGWMLIMAVIIVISTVMFLWNDRKAATEKQLTEATELSLT